VNAEREVVDVGLLTSQIEDTDLGVGNTTVEPGLGVRLDSRKLVSIHRFPHRINHSRQSNGISRAIVSVLCDRHLLFPKPIPGPQARPPRNPHRKCSKPTYRTHLVLAVAVAAGGTTSHFDCCFVELGDKFVEGVVSKSKREGFLLTGGTLGLISNQLPLTSGKALSPIFSANQRPKRSRTVHDAFVRL
jgi:hypothetical protein